MTISKTFAAAFTAIAFVLGGSAAAMAFPATAIDNGKVHTKASKNANVVDKLHYGETVNVKQCVKGGNWCYITHKGPDGWVRASALDLDYRYYDEDFGFYDGGKGNVTVCLGGFVGKFCISD